jgi:hypothetical protein
VHTAFTKGLQALPFDVDQFANDIFFWFKLSAARREDFANIQIDELLEETGQYFIKPVASRWLSLGTVCKRLVKQYPALLTYFLKTFPKSPNSKAACQGDRYKRIKTALEDKATASYLHFVSFPASSLSEFVKLFQTNEPLVHVLYDKLNELVRNVMLKFMKVDSARTAEGAQLVALKCNESEHWLSLKEVNIGTATRFALAKIENANNRKEVTLSFRQCFMKIARYLQETLPLTNPVLRDLACLQPKARKLEESKSAISRLCLHLRKVTKTDDFYDDVEGEWLLYMSDKSVSEIETSFNTSGDICSYWHKVSEVSDGRGEKKFAKLTCCKSGIDNVA